MNVSIEGIPLSPQISLKDHYYLARRLSRLSLTRPRAEAMFRMMPRHARDNFQAAWKAVERDIQEQAVDAMIDKRPLCSIATSKKKKVVIESFRVSHLTARVRDTFYALMLAGVSPDQCGRLAIRQWGALKSRALIQ